MKVSALTLLGLIVVILGCHPSPPGAGPTTTACGLSPNQSGNGLSMNCTVTGPIPNLRVDPLVAGNAPCGINSWIISGQTVNTPLVAVYGQNGDDSAARVRLGVTLGPGTHNGSIAKDGPSCNSTVGPTLGIMTSFTGTHVALIDKTRSPMCVFQSKLTLTSFNQTIAAGVPLDISGMTKKGVQGALEKRVDLELAKAVNGLLNASANLSGAFSDDSGRCHNDWQPFTGN